MVYYINTTQHINAFLVRIMQGELPVDTIGIGVFDQPFAWSGQKTDLVNKGQLKRRNIILQETNGAGGTGIISPGSIAMIKVAKTEDDIHTYVEEVFNLLIDKLREHNIECKYIGNDFVLIKGNRKLCGFSFGQLPNGNYFCGLYINIYVDIKLINIVCIKRRSPFALSEYGIKTDEVVSWFKELWKKETWIQLD